MDNKTHTHKKHIEKDHILPFPFTRLKSHAVRSSPDKFRKYNTFGFR